MARGFLMVLALHLCGCHASLPTYPSMPASDAVSILRERTAGIDTIEASSTIVMHNAVGDDVVLDGALVARHPGWLRLRAWKFNTAVFDITLTPDGLWMFTSDRGAKSLEEGVTANDIAAGWSVVTGEFLGESPEVLSSGDDQLVLQGPPDDRGQRTRCYVDTKTLTPRRYVVENDAGQALYEVGLSKYRMHGALLWPHKLTLESQQGRVIIEMRDVLLNEEPSPLAFQPPRDAVKQP